MCPDRTGTDGGMSTESAGVPAAESGMTPTTTKTASVATTAAVTASAMLRPDGHGQRKRERRNGDQATHAANIIAPPGKPGAGFSDQWAGVAKRTARPCPTVGRVVCGDKRAMRRETASHAAGAVRFQRKNGAPPDSCVERSPRRSAHTITRRAYAHQRLFLAGTRSLRAVLVFRNRGQPDRRVPSRFIQREPDRYHWSIRLFVVSPSACVRGNALRYYCFALR
jgi:hypothetical protein